MMADLLDEPPSSLFDLRLLVPLFKDPVHLVAKIEGDLVYFGERGGMS